MHDEIARLEAEIAKLQHAIQTLAGMPAAQTPLQAQLEAKQAELATLRPPANSYHGDLVAGNKQQGDTIQTGNISGTGIAIGTGARSTVYIDGRQRKSNDALLAAYYQRLAHSCRDMPLQGVYEQRSTTDSLTIDLERVYTQLATTATSAREQVAGDALARFDAKEFLKAHTGMEVLPHALRTHVEPRFPARVTGEHESDDAVGLSDNDQMAAGLAGGMKRGFASGATPLTNDSRAQIERYAQTAEQLTFFGPQLVSEAIAAAPRLVLLGEPGSGKSTALRYLAYMLAGAGLDPQFDLNAHLAGWTPGRLLPIFAPLLPLAQRFAENPGRQGNAGDLWEYLVDQMQPKSANAGLAGAIHEELEAGRVILLLDGLDEVAGSESRRKVVRAVAAFATNYPACRIVVACRVRAYEGERNTAWHLPGWPAATLADWTLSQMLAFVHAWYHTVAELRVRPASWRDDRIAGLRRALIGRADLQHFGRQPLMMTVMALVQLNDGRLPEERASLYGRPVHRYFAWPVGTLR